MRDRDPAASPRPHTDCAAPPDPRPHGPRVSRGRRVRLRRGEQFRTRRIERRAVQQPHIYEFEPQDAAQPRLRRRMAGRLSDPAVEYEFDFEREEWERKKGGRGGMREREREREKRAVESSRERGKIH